MVLGSFLDRQRLVAPTCRHPLTSAGVLTATRLVLYGRWFPAQALLLVVIEPKARYQFRG